MKGFIVRHNNQEIHASLPDGGVVGLELVLQEYNSFWNTSGLVLSSGEKCLWNSDSLDIGTEIEIEFVQMHKPTVTLNELHSCDKEIRKRIHVRSEEDELQMVLKEFRLLGKLLNAANKE